MTNKNTYKVILSNQLEQDVDRADVIKNLAQLFKISEDKASHLFSKNETVIKQDVDEATAKKYQLAISKTGAQSRIVNTAAEDELDLPVIAESVKKLDEKNLSRTPNRLGLDHALGRVGQVDVARQHKQTEELKVLDNFTEQSYCPECGTIRDAKSSLCHHCGYDPTVKKRIVNVDLFKQAAKVLLVMIMLLLIVYATWPFYKQYQHKQQVLEGLDLAFETRNSITQFIQNNNFFPNQNIDANLPKRINNEIIESIIIGENAVFTVTLRPDVLMPPGSYTLIFEPKTLRGKLVWNCMQGTLPNEYRPIDCQKP